MDYKNILTYFFLFLFCFLVTSCETKKSEVQSASPDGLVNITVSGTKSFMEPWKLVIEIKAGDKSNKMETELYADELTKSNILFNWTDNKTCMLTLIHQDGESRMVEITL